MTPHLVSMETGPHEEPDHQANAAYEYRLLKPDAYHTEARSPEELFETYVGLLNRLVDRIAGSEYEEGYDTVVFLDKSARPLYWMLKEFWPYMAPQKRDPNSDEVITASMPDVKFVNIDRMIWRRKPNMEIEEGGARDVTERDIKGLQAIFHPRGKGDNLLDDKRILIVDEQSETGDTLRAALDLFKKAFPSSTVDATAWINHQYEFDKNRERTFTVKEIPVWYPERDPKTGLQYSDTGRGVLSPVEFNPHNPAHGDPERFPPESYEFLSTRPLVTKESFSVEEQLELADLRHRLSKAIDPEEKKKLRDTIDRKNVMRDPASVRLREEIAHMAVDFVAGRFFPAITTDRIEIKGMDPLEYGNQARARRVARSRIGLAALGIEKKRSA